MTAAKKKKEAIPCSCSYMWISVCVCVCGYVYACWNTWWIRPTRSFVSLPKPRRFVILMSMWYMHAICTQMRWCLTHASGFLDQRVCVNGFLSLCGQWCIRIMHVVCYIETITCCSFKLYNFGSFHLQDHSFALVFGLILSKLILKGARVSTILPVVRCAEPVW